MTVNDFINLLEYNELPIIIYDDLVTGDDSDDYGDLLWTSTSDKEIPDEVYDFEILGIDVEKTLVRLWVRGEGIPHKYDYGDNW